MRIAACVGVAVLAGVAVAQPAAPEPRRVVRAVAESSLTTAGGNIRQFAFDGDPKTHFASAGKAKAGDHFTLTFDAPVELRSASVSTGRADGTDKLDAAAWEVSTDGTKFTFAGLVTGGFGAVQPHGPIRALRLSVTHDLGHPLVVREFELDTTPKVVVFRHPIEFILDVSDAPEMKAWGDKVVRVCEREYPDICDFLASAGYTPPTQLRMTLKTDYKGVAAAGGGRITGSVKYFKDRPDDIGAMVHETVHCVQQYKGRGNPGWLVEGIADYVRFWKYEPGKAGRLPPERAKYDGSYRTTASFLAFVTETYDRRAVPTLNAMCREGRYTPEVWRALTGKSVEELEQEWRASLAR